MGHCNYLFVSSALSFSSSTTLVHVVPSDGELGARKGKGDNLW